MKASIIKKFMMGALAASLVMAPAMSAFATTTVVAEPVVESAAETVPQTSSVAGTNTTVNGAYTATSVTGSAVTTAAATVKESYGLTSNERPYTKISDMDVKKSYLAKQSIDLAAASQGAEVGPMLNVELGKMTGGKYSLLPSDGAEIRLSFGIPKGFAEADKTFAVVCVRAGGEISVLTDVDSNPNTVTFDTTGGAGAYAIIKY